MCYDTYLIDCKLPTPYTHYYIPPEGFILDPNKLYLASTIEYTETHSHLSILEGKSSLGRLGLSIHITAGKGDVGFCNHWTLELWCLIPIRIYAGMPIGQLIYHEVKGFVQRPYNEKASAKYNDRDPLPQPSKFYKNF
jgi:dCTP deaminase